jgi:Flp pilus assembly protein TadG
MKKRGQRGSAMVEFALAGVGTMILFISTIQLAIGMWNYHTLAYAVHEATRYAATHGANCDKIGYTCSINVGTLASKIHSLSIGIPDHSVVVTLTTQSGAVTTCNPLNNCYTSTTKWPPSTNLDNKVGNRITISANYQYHSALLFFWPGSGTLQFGAISLPASSTSAIVF